MLPYFDLRKQINDDDDDEKRGLFGGKKGLKSSFNKLKLFYSRYF